MNTFFEKITQNRAKIIRKQIKKGLNKISSTKQDELYILAREKVFLEEYYKNNSSNIDTTTFIDLYNYYSGTQKNLLSFFSELITTIGFTLVYEMLLSEEAGIGNIILALFKLAEEARLLVAKIVIVASTIIVALIMGVIVYSFTKNLYNRIEELFFMYNAYDKKELNEYHCKLLSQILLQREKIEQNRVEYELQEKLNLDYGIKKYTLEIID